MRLLRSTTRRAVTGLVAVIALIAVGPVVVDAAVGPFTDVGEDRYYADPVRWAYDNGITTGTSDTTFSPGAAVTRAEVVTFLHRYHENVVSDLELGGADLDGFGCSDDQVIENDDGTWRCADVEVLETLGGFDDRTLASAGKPGFYLDAVIGPDGNPLIASMMLGSITFSMTSCHNPTCNEVESSIVDSSGFVGFDPEIAVPSDGRPIAVYTDQTTPRGLGSFKCDDSFCQSGTVVNLDDGDGVFVGYQPQIAINGFGNPVIAHRNLGTNRLELLVCLDPACESTVTRMPTEFVAPNIDMAILTQPNGNPLVLYSGWAEHLYAYACHDANCTSGSQSIVIEGADVETMEAIIGTDGRAIVFWLDYTNGEIHLLRCTADDCSSGVDRIVPIEPGTLPGGYPSMTLGVDGRPIVGLHDHETNELVLYHCADLGCTDGTFEHLGIEGVFNQVLVHDNGDTLVVYYDDVSESLKLLVAEMAATSVAVG